MFASCIIIQERKINTTNNLAVYQLPVLQTISFRFRGKGQNPAHIINHCFMVEVTASNIGKHFYLFHLF